MNAIDLRRFLIACGADDENIMEASGGVWMNTHCPMAFYTHGSGEDEHPSFGATISDDGHSVYYCFGCTPEPKPLLALLHNLWLMGGSYPEEAARIYSLCENLKDEETKAIAVPDLWERPIYVPRSIPLQALAEKFPLLQWATTREAESCRQYLESRGIPRWVQNYFQVRYRFEDHTLAFVLTDKLGRSFVVRQRSRHRKDIWTARWPGLEISTPKHVGVWFGMWLLDHHDQRAVILVEGEIDAMRLAALGFSRVLASATSSVTDAQMNALMWDTYILGYDVDKSGQRAHEKLIKRLAPVASLFVADWSLATRKDGKPCKDAGDLPDVAELDRVFSRLKVIR